MRGYYLDVKNLNNVDPSPNFEICEFLISKENLK